MDEGSRGTRPEIWREELSRLGKVFLSTVVRHEYQEVSPLWVPLEVERVYAPLEVLAALPVYVSAAEELVFLPDILFPDRLFSQWSQKMSLVLSSE